jgi:hypothetical protein
MSFYVEGVGIMRMILHFLQWLICVNTAARRRSNTECLNMNYRKEVHDIKALQARDIVFRVENLTKVYLTGEVEVKELNGIDLLLYSGEMAVLPGLPAVASQRFSISSEARSRHGRTGHWYRCFIARRG